MNTLATLTIGHTLRGLLLLLLFALISGIIIIATSCRVPGLRPAAGVIQTPARPHLCTVEPAGFFSWGFIARNGVTVHASNRAHADKADAIAHYATVRNAMVQKGSPDRITRPAEDEGLFRWLLLEDPTGADSHLLEMSDQGFTSANAARENYTTLREAVLDCPPQDLDESLID